MRRHGTKCNNQNSIHHFKRIIPPEVCRITRTGRRRTEPGNRFSSSRGSNCPMQRAPTTDAENTGRQLAIDKRLETASLFPAQRRADRRRARDYVPVRASPHVSTAGPHCDKNGVHETRRHGCLHRHHETPIFRRTTPVAAAFVLGGQMMYADSIRLPLQFSPGKGNLHDYAGSLVVQSV